MHCVEIFKGSSDTETRPLATFLLPTKLKNLFFFLQVLRTEAMKRSVVEGSRPLGDLQHALKSHHTGNFVFHLHLKSTRRGWESNSRPWAQQPNPLATVVGYQPNISHTKVWSFIAR